MVIMGEITRVTQAYTRYYAGRAVDRDDLLMNREVLFQTFAFEKANTGAYSVSALIVQRRGFSTSGAGGSGAGLLSFMRWGFPPQFVGNRY